MTENNVFPCFSTQSKCDWILCLMFQLKKKIKKEKESSDLISLVCIVVIEQVTEQNPFLYGKIMDLEKRRNVK